MYENFLFAMNLVLIIFIIGIVSYYLYKMNLINKIREKGLKQVQREIKRTIKSNKGELFPDDWLVNENVKDLDGFLDNIQETDLKGKNVLDFLSFLKGNNTKGTYQNMILNEILTDSKTVDKLSKQFGINPKIITLIATFALKNVAKLFGKGAINLFSKQYLDDKSEKSEKKVKKRRKMININESESSSLSKLKF